MWLAFAEVKNSECEAPLAPRYWPGSQPCDRSIFCPKVSVFRDQAVLLGSLAHLRLLEPTVSQKGEFGNEAKGGRVYFLVPARPIAVACC